MSKRRLPAPPEAQQRYAALKAKDAFAPGKERAADAKRRLAVQANPLWATSTDRSSPGGPTPQRDHKEGEGWRTRPTAGRDVGRRRKSFLETYGRHFKARHFKAAEDISTGLALEDRSSITSSRAYTGAAPGRGNSEREGHMPLNPEERVRYDRFRRVWKRFVAENVEWSYRIRILLIGEMDDASGMFLSAGMMGAQTTAYSASSDAATGAGVQGLLDALDVWLQTSYMVHLEVTLEERERMRLLEQAATDAVLDGRGRRRFTAPTKK